MTRFGKNAVCLRPLARAANRTLRKPASALWQMPIWNSKIEVLVAINHGASRTAPQGLKGYSISYSCIPAPLILSNSCDFPEWPKVISGISG